MPAWQWPEPRAVDGAIALVLTVVTQIEVGGPVGAGGRGALLITLALAVRRRWPLAVAGLGGLGAALQGLAASPPSSFGEYVALTLAIYTVAEREPLARAALGGVLVVAGIVLHDVDSRFATWVLTVEKLAVRDRVQAVAVAYEAGLMRR